MMVSFVTTIIFSLVFFELFRSNRSSFQNRILHLRGCQFRLRCNRVLLMRNSVDFDQQFLFVPKFSSQIPNFSQYLKQSLEKSVFLNRFSYLTKCLISFDDCWCILTTIFRHFFLLDLISSGICVLELISLLWKQPPWKPPWKKRWNGTKDASFLLYRSFILDHLKEKLSDEMMVTRYLWPLKNTIEGSNAIGGRRLISVKEESCQFYFSIHYIWYRKTESSLKIWKHPWKKRRFRANGTSFMLYGDVLRIVEGWQSRFLFISRESIYWIQNRRTSLAPNWELVNVIQQKKLCTISSVLRVLQHIYCSFIWVFEDDNRLKTNVMKAYRRKNCLDLSPLLYFLLFLVMYMAVILLCFVFSM